MEKPQLITIKKTYYDYHELVRYLEYKHKVKLRDFGGQYTEGKRNPEAEYLDFWHWLIGHYEDDVYNGAELNFSPGEILESYPDEPEWVRTILGWFAEEFGVEFPICVRW